jgi:ribosomal protein S1
VSEEAPDPADAAGLPAGALPPEGGEAASGAEVPTAAAVEAAAEAAAPATGENGPAQLSQEAPRAGEMPAPPRLRGGATVEGTVTAVAADHALVDVGAKSDGVLALSEAVLAEGQALAQALAPGQKILVTVIGFDAGTGGPRLSQRRAAIAAAWRRVEQAHRDGAPIDAPVREVVKGGLVCDIGVRGFMPASQVERGPVADLSAYVGQTLQAKVLECDRTRNKAILSRRALLEADHRRRRDDLWTELAEGQIRRGVVKALADFGAFIDLGGVDGLLHVSAMSWGRVERPADLLAVGQSLDVKILRVDREHEKVSLGLKQVAPDPWSEAEARYPVGAVVQGKVMRLCPFGAFVQLEPGVDGLVHISQLADQRVRDPGEVVHEGEVVAVKVLRVAPEERRISLSLREAQSRGPAVGHGREPAAGGAARSGGATVGEVVGNLGALLEDAASRDTSDPRRGAERP